MPLEFHEDAICLSGLLGTKLKSKIIGDYYKLWWQITSGGKTQKYGLGTVIVELNAATGEIYIEELEETIMGSSGHALELKFNNKYSPNPNLSVVLIEEDDLCSSHLRNYIKKKYPEAIFGDKDHKIKDFEQYNKLILVHKTIDDAIKTINELELKGRSIYFFDPLRNVNFEYISQVYSKRNLSYRKTGVEFLIFSFTSDWIFGRKEFSALPNNTDENLWTSDELKSVNQLNGVLGDTNWQSIILTNELEEFRIEKMIQAYVNRLFDYFRFVIPFPFQPKENQTYHILFCSNSVAGASIITNFYRKYTSNKWEPNNAEYYKIFKKKYQSKISFPERGRPDEWKLLWHLIKNYIFGKYDRYCAETHKECNLDVQKIDKVIKWLLNENLIQEYRSERYELNLEVIQKKLGLDKPEPFKPLTDKEIAKKNFEQNE